MCKIKRALLVACSVGLMGLGAGHWIRKAQTQGMVSPGWTAEMDYQFFHHKMGINNSERRVIHARNLAGHTSTTAIVRGVQSPTEVVTDSATIFFSPQLMAKVTLPRIGATRPGIPSSVGRAIAPEFDPTCGIPPKGQAATTYTKLGNDVYFGLDVVKWKVVRGPDSDGETTESEEWEAPACGCLQVRRHYVLKQADGTYSASTTESLKNFTFGQPSDEWFVPPDGTEEVSPTEFQYRFKQLTNQNAWDEQTLARFEKRYSQRPN